MTRLTRRAVLGGAVLLTGCATSVEVSGDYKAGRAFTMSLDRSWSDISAVMPYKPKNVRLLSVDGPLLNRLYVLAGLEPGESLVGPRDRDTPRPQFRADMSDTETVEFITDCVAAMEFQAPEASNLRPQSFGGAPGVRFDLTTRTAEGLNFSGTALTARVRDRLNALLYLAPQEHYYNSLLANVEATFASVRLSA